MLQDDLKIYLEDIQADFLAGRLEELISRFSVPLVVYSVGGVVVLRTMEEILSQTVQYRSALMEMSVVSSVIKVVSREPPVNNRLRATVRVTDFNADGEVVTGSLIRYFLILKNGSYMVEMLEYLEAPFSTEVVEKLVH